MPCTYKSKTDHWIVLVVATIVTLSLLPVLALSFSPGLVAVTVATVALCVFPLYSISYTICGNTLHVKCCIILNKKYDIAQISRIVPTRTFLSAPAASLDRLAVYFEHQPSPLVLSPQDKQAFIRHLQSVNPRIKCGQ